MTPSTRLCVVCGKRKPARRMYPWKGKMKVRDQRAKRKRFACDDCYERWVREPNDWKVRANKIRDEDE